MAVTSIRLDAEATSTLDRLAVRFGGRSAAIRAALQRLDEQAQREAAIDAYLEQWEDEFGPIDEALVDEMDERYFS